MRQMKDYGKAMVLKVYLMYVSELHTQMNPSQVIQYLKSLPQSTSKILHLKDVLLKFSSNYILFYYLYISTICYILVITPGSYYIIS